MNNNKGRQEYGVFLNNDDLKRKVMESKNLLTGIGDKTIVEGARIENAYKRVGQTIATLGGTVAVGALAKELYVFANAFDKSMKEVSTLSATVTNDLDGFKKSVLNMTTDIPVGADAAAKALYQIVSAGHDGANGLHVLEIASKAAIGGVTETVTAADAITTLLNAYKKDASEATNISDQLFTTVRLGKTTFGELGHHIAQVAPIAASFGIEMDQVLAAVATLTKSGTPTAQAMTQIRSAIVESTKVLGDGYFSTHTFQEGLSEIATMANGSEAEMRKLIPSIEAMTGVLGLTGINAKMAASDLGELNNSLGSTEQAYKKMVDQATAQVDLLKNKMLAKFHDIGAGAVDMVGSVAKFLNEDGVFSDTALDDLIATMGVLIVTVGTYQAQLITTNAVKSVGQDLRYAAEIAELQRLIGVKNVEKNQDLQKLVDNKKLTADQATKIASLRVEVAEKIKAMQVDSTKAALEAKNAAQADQIALKRALQAEQTERSARQELSRAIQLGNAEKIRRAEIKLAYAEEFLNIELKDRAATADALELANTKKHTTELAVNNLQQKLNNSTTIAGGKAKNFMTLATQRLGTAFRGLGKAFMANPFGLVLTAVTMAVSAFMMFKKETEDVADATETLTSKTRELTSAIEDLSASKYLQTKSFEELKKLYPDTLKNMTLENYLLADKTALLKKMNEEREKEMFDKQDKRLSDAKAELADLEKKYKVTAATSELQKKVGSNHINNAKKELAEAKKIVDDRNAILKKVAEPPKASVSIEEQIKAIDSDIKKLDDHTARLSEKMIERDAIANGFLLSSNRNTKPLGYKPFEFKLDPDFAVDPVVQSNQNIAETERLEAKKATLKKQLEDEAKAKVVIGKKLSNDQKKILEEINKELLSLEESNEIERQDRKIALMADGADKEIAQINLDYDRKISALKTVADKWKTAQGDKLTTDQKAQVDVAKKGYEQDRDTGISLVKTNQAVEDKAELDALLKELETFEQRRTAITEKYNKDRELIINSDRNLLDKGRAIGGLEDEYNKDIKSVDDDEFAVAKKGANVISKVFDDTSKKSIADINKIRDEANKLISYLANTKSEDIIADFGMTAEQLRTLQASSDELDSLTNGVEALHAAGVEKNPFGQLATDVKSLFKVGKEGDKETLGLEKKLSLLGQSASASANMIGGLTSGLSDMFTAMGNDKMAGIADGIGMAMTSISNVASGFASGGIVGGIAAVAGELINFATMAFEAEARHQAALDAIVQSKIEQQKEYNSLLREQNLLYEQGNTVFGADDFGKANNAIKQSKLDSDAIKKQMAEIANVEIVTGHKKTGLFGWGKGKDTYSNILDVYDDLIDAEGKLDVERAKSILATQNMSDAHRDAIEEGIELTEQYEESVAIMNDYLINIFGDMGSTMADMITDNWRNNTTDALDYGSAVGGMLEQLAKDAAMSMHLAPILEKAQLEIDKINRDTSLTEEQRALALQKIATETAKGLAAAESGYINTLEVMQDAAKKEGVDIFEPDKEEEDDRQASSSSTITASQDSVNESNGRLTVIQGHTYETNEGVKALTGYAHSFKESFSWLQSNAADQLRTLQGIETNTSPIAAMHNEITNMRSTLDSIQLHGLKLKK